MTSRVVPKWGELPASAPAAHHEAWERAWTKAPPPRQGSTASTNTERIHKMLLALASDEQAPAELVSETVTAHVTEGRGAPDGVGPRGLLLLRCLERDLWRDSWIPAALIALQESEREFPLDQRLELTLELLSKGRTPSELRPMILVVSALARPQRRSDAIRTHLSKALSAPDVDRKCAGELFRLLKRPGWFVVRPEGWRHHSQLDESTRSSLRRCKPVHLPITAACVLAADDLRARDTSLGTSGRRLRKVADAQGGEGWSQPRLPEMD